MGTKIKIKIYFYKVRRKVCVLMNLIKYAFEKAYKKFLKLLLKKLLYVYHFIKLKNN